MKPSTRILLFASILLVFSCKKDSSSGSSGNEIGNGTVDEKMIQTNIAGQVFDENGAPMSGVSVSGGTVTVKTDAYGFFSLQNTSINQNGGLITAKMAFYFTAYRNLFYQAGGNHFVQIQMLRRSPVAVFEGTQQQVVKVKDCTIRFAANSFVYPDTKEPCTGYVNVYATYYPDSGNDFFRKCAGNLYTSRSDNSVSAMESQGILIVEFEDYWFRKLELAEGVEATVEMPAMKDGPQSLTTYSFNTKTGLWMAEGSASKVGANYVYKAKHFSFWTAAAAFPAVDLEAVVVDAENNPVPNKLIVVARASGKGIPAAFALSDSSGRVYGKVPQNESLQLLTYSDCEQVILSKNIGPFSANVNLGNIQTASGLPWVEIKGKIKGCSLSGGTAKRGYAQVNVNGKIYYSPVTATGDFVAKFINCSAATYASVVAVNTEEGKESFPKILTLAPKVDAGVLTACSDILGPQQSYFSYSIDAAGYSYRSAGEYVQGLVYTGGYVFITGFDDYAFRPSGGNFSFNAPTFTPGVYPLVGPFSHTNVQDQMLYHSIDSNPISVHVTGFGREGEYITGYIKDSVLDENNKPHLLNCNFMVKRYNR